MGTFAKLKFYLPHLAASCYQRLFHPNAYQQQRDQRLAEYKRQVFIERLDKYHNALNKVQYYLDNNPRLLHIIALAKRAGFTGAVLPAGRTKEEFLSLNSDQREVGSRWHKDRFSKQWAWIKNGLEHWQYQFLNVLYTGGSCRSKEERRRRILGIADLLSNPAFVALINPALRAELRKAAKSLECGTDGKRDLLVITKRDKKTGDMIGLDLHEMDGSEPVFRAKLRRRSGRKAWIVIGRILGFIVALGCGFVTGVSVWQQMNLYLGIAAFFAGTVANFFLFFTKTPMVLINVVVKKWNRSVFKGLSNNFEGDTRRLLIGLSIVLALGTAISMAFLTYFKINKAFVLFGIAGITTHIFAGLIAIPTFFGIFAMMFSAMSSLIRLGVDDMQLGFLRIIGRPPGMGQGVYVVKLIITVLILLLGAIVGYLSASALLGVMHASSIQVLKSTFELAPALAASLATIIVYYVCRIPRMIFNILNTARYLSTVTAWGFHKLHYNISQLWKGATKPPLFSAPKSSVGTKTLTVSITMGFMMIFNAAGTIALTCLSAGTTLVAHIINATFLLFGFHPIIPLSFDKGVAGGVGGATSLAVNWNAFKDSFRSFLMTSPALMGLYYQRVSAPCGEGLLKTPECGWDRPKPPSPHKLSMINLKRRVSSGEEVSMSDEVESEKKHQCVQKGGMDGTTSFSAPTSPEHARRKRDKRKGSHKNKSEFKRPGPAKHCKFFSSGSESNLLAYFNDPKKIQEVKLQLEQIARELTSTGQDTQAHHQQGSPLQGGSS